LSAKAEKSLIRLGVRVRSGVKVVEIDDHGVTLNASDGTGRGTDRIAARTVIWAAGVQPSAFGAIVARATGARLDNGGRVVVNPDCTVPGHPEIFIIGDLAHFEQDGKALSGVAQVAMQQGRYAARLIQNRLRGRAAGKPFRYFDKGGLAVIGRGRAVAKIRRLHLSGFMVWLIWVFIHLMCLVEFWD